MHGGKNDPLLKTGLALTLVTVKIILKLLLGLHAGWSLQDPQRLLCNRGSYSGVFPPNWAITLSQKYSYKPTLQSNLHFMVAALYHFPINTSWFLIDFILCPLPELRILCLLGQHKEGKPILTAVFNAAANHGD